MIHSRLRNDELAFKNIEQFYISVEREAWKLDTLCDLYEIVMINQAVIFSNNREKATLLMDQILARGLVGFVLVCLYIVSCLVLYPADDYSVSI